MVYDINGEIKEFAMSVIAGVVPEGPARGIIWAEDTASAPPNCFATPSLEINFSECAGQLWTD